MPMSSPSIATQTVSRQSPEYGAIDINVATAGETSAPLVVFVHGWPESWHTWRTQMRDVVANGYRAAAIDVRGYGGSTRPAAVGAYRLRELAADLASVIEKLAPDGQAVVVGHDWGAPVAYQTARLHPGLVRGVVGMSVPYIPATPGDPMELWNLVYANRFFYMKYFAATGIAEAAFEADLPAALRKIYYAASADAPSGLWTSDQPEDTAMLDFLVDPSPLPGWMSAERIGEVVAANDGGPTHGWFNRYRAQHLDGADLAEAAPEALTQPACFIAGSQDIVRNFVEGVDLFAGATNAYADNRGMTLIEGAGHWVQQEKANETSEAIVSFLGSL